MAKIPFNDVFFAHKKRRRRRRNHHSEGHPLVRRFPSYQPKFDVLAEVERQLGHSVRSEKAKKFLQNELPPAMAEAVKHIRNEKGFKDIIDEERAADKKAIEDRLGPMLDVLKGIFH